MRQETAVEDGRAMGSSLTSKRSYASALKIPSLIPPSEGVSLNERTTREPLQLSRQSASETRDSSLDGRISNRADIRHHGAHQSVRPAEAGSADAFVSDDGSAQVLNSGSDSAIPATARRRSTSGSPIVPVLVGSDETPPGTPLVGSAWKAATASVSPTGREESDRIEDSGARLDEESAAAAQAATVTTSYVMAAAATAAATAAGSDTLSLLLTAAAYGFTAGVSFASGGSNNVSGAGGVGGSGGASAFSPTPSEREARGPASAATPFAVPPHVSVEGATPRHGQCYHDQHPHATPMTPAPPLTPATAWALLPRMSPLHMAHALPPFSPLGGGGASPMMLAMMLPDGGGGFALSPAALAGTAGGGGGRKHASMRGYAAHRPGALAPGSSAQSSPARPGSARRSWRASPGDGDGMAALPGHQQQPQQRVRWSESDDAAGSPAVRAHVHAPPHVRRRAEPGRLHLRPDSPSSGSQAHHAGGTISGSLTTRSDGSKSSGGTGSTAQHNSGAAMAPGGFSVSLQRYATRQPYGADGDGGSSTGISGDALDSHRMLQHHLPSPGSGDALAGFGVCCYVALDGRARRYCVASLAPLHHGARGSQLDPRLFALVQQRQPQRLAASPSSATAALVAAASDAPPPPVASTVGQPAWKRNQRARHAAARRAQDFLRYLELASGTQAAPGALDEAPAAEAAATAVSAALHLASSLPDAAVAAAQVTAWVVDCVVSEHNRGKHGEGGALQPRPRFPTHASDYPDLLPPSPSPATVEGGDCYPASPDTGDSPRTGGTAVAGYSFALPVPAPAQPPPQQLLQLAALGMGGAPALSLLRCDEAWQLDSEEARGGLLRSLLALWRQPPPLPVGPAADGGAAVTVSSVPFTGASLNAASESSTPPQAWVLLPAHALGLALQLAEDAAALRWEPTAAKTAPVTVAAVSAPAAPAAASVGPSASPRLGAARWADVAKSPRLGATSGAGASGSPARPVPAASSPLNASAPPHLSLAPPAPAIAPAVAAAGMGQDAAGPMPRVVATVHGAFEPRVAAAFKRFPAPSAAQAHILQPSPVDPVAVAANETSTEAAPTAPAPAALERVTTLEGAAPACSVDPSDASIASTLPRAAPRLYMSPGATTAHRQEPAAGPLLVVLQLSTQSR